MTFESVLSGDALRALVTLQSEARPCDHHRSHDGLSILKACEFQSMQEMYVYNDASYKGKGKLQKQKGTQNDGVLDALSLPKCQDLPNISDRMILPVMQLHCTLPDNCNLQHSTYVAAHQQRILDIIKALQIAECLATLN